MYNFNNKNNFALRIRVVKIVLILFLVFLVLPDDNSKA